MQDTSNVKNRAIFNSMNSNLSGVTVEDIFRAKQDRITFCVYESSRFMNAGIEDLDLSPRSYNCLKRAGRNTVGDIVNSISCGDDLKAIRNCGVKCIKEIMTQIFVFNYECLSPEMQKRCMAKLVEMNGIPKEGQKCINDMKIEDLELSFHTCLPLFRAGIFKVNQLTAMTKEELHHVRNLGPSGCKDILERCEKLGLNFRTE